MKKLLITLLFGILVLGCGKKEGTSDNTGKSLKPGQGTEVTVQTERPEAAPDPVQEKLQDQADVKKPEKKEDETEKAAEVIDVSEPSGWQHTGWGGGGFFWSTVFDPSDGNTIYLGGDVGGIYKSTDKGLNFRFINKGLGDYAVYSMAISRSNPKVLYALTNSGISRTDDGGENWVHLDKTDKNGLNILSHRPKSVRALAVDPKDSSVVYAGSRNGRLFKSKDGGTSWKQLDFLAGTKTESFESAYSGKGYASVTFASSKGTWEEAGRIQRVFPDGKDFTGYLSLSAMVKIPVDAPRIDVQMVVQTGEKWLWQDSPYTELAKGVWAEISLDLAKVKDLDKVRALYVIARSPEAGFKGKILVDAVTLRTRNKKEIISDWEDPGSAEGWKANPGTAKYSFIKDVKQAGQGSIVQPKGTLSSVCVSPADSNLVMATSTAHGLMRSADGGKTWEKIKAPDNAACVIIHSDGKLMYTAFWKNGIMKSADSGKTWTSASAGIDKAFSVREVVINPKNPDIAYAISQKGWNGMVFKTTDGGANWKALTRSITYTKTSGNPTSETGHGDLSRLSNIALNPENPDEIFMAANWRNIFSKDGGTTWEERSKGADITCFQDLQFIGTDVYAVAMDEGLFTSSDNGRTWKHLFPPKYIAGLSGHQWRVRVMKKGNQTKIVSTLYPWENQGGPYKILVSEDTGKTIKHTIAGLPKKITHKDTMWGNGYPRAIAVHPANPDIIYLGIDGEPEPARGIEGGGVFRSDDGGYTWKRLPAQPASRRMFFGLDIDPTDPKRIYWATCGDKGGVYMSEDEGNSWKRVFKGETWFFNCAVNRKGVVYAGANNLYRSTDKGKTWEKIGDFKDNWSVVGIAFDPDNESRMWVSQVPWGEKAQGHIFVTEDNCKTWKDITEDIPYKKPMTLRYNPRTKELWAAGVGVYKIKQ